MRRALKLRQVYYTFVEITCTMFDKAFSVINVPKAQAIFCQFEHRHPPPPWEKADRQPLKNKYIYIYISYLSILNYNRWIFW